MAIQFWPPKGRVGGHGFMQSVLKASRVGGAWIVNVENQTKTVEVKF